MQDEIRVLKEDWNAEAMRLHREGKKIKLIRGTEDGLAFLITYEQGTEVRDAFRVDL